MKKRYILRTFPASSTIPATLSRSARNKLRRGLTHLAIASIRRLSIARWLPKSKSQSSTFRSCPIIMENLINL